MQIFLRGLEGCTHSVELPTTSVISDLAHAALVAEGVLLRDLRMIYNGVQLPESNSAQASSTLKSMGIGHQSTVHMLLRLRGGSGMKVVLNVQPRLQKEKWSLYWKESMATKTVVMDTLSLEVDGSTTIAEVQQMTAKLCKWEPVESLTRLEGFNEPWEKAISKGVDLKADRTLEALSLGNGAVITTVRKQLVPEGWQMIKEGEEEDDLSSTDEENDF